jgi:predicted TIM-barrel enzyme
MAPRAKGARIAAADVSQPSTDPLARVRHRVDEISADFRVRHDAPAVIAALEELSRDVERWSSLAALIDGAAHLIERGEPPEQRLQRLADHLHGYSIGWSDAIEARAR